MLAERLSPNPIDILNETMQDYGSTAKMLSEFELLNQVIFSPSFYPLLETVFHLDFPSCVSVVSYVG